MTATVDLLSLARGLVRNLPRVPGQLLAIPSALRADPDRYGGIGDLVARNARRWPFRAALLFEDERWSWRRLDRAADRYARALSRGGVGPGDAVPILSANRPELLVAVVALAKIGAVAAPLNPGLPAAALEALVPAGSQLICEPGRALSGRRGWALVRPGEDCPPGYDDPGAGGFAQPLQRAVRLGEPALHVFTSGTTGFPKASVMTHLRWRRAATLYGRILVGLRRGDVVYCPLPLFHNLALTAAFGGVVVTGTTLALADGFSASRYWADVRRFDATVLPYIGEVPRYLLARPPGAGDRDHRVRAAFGVGMPRDCWAEFQRRFGVASVFESYAASEGNTGFFNVFDQTGSVGFCPTPHAIVRYDVQRGEIVTDGQGRPVRARRGETGLLLGKVTPRFDFDGYTDPEATERKVRRDVFRRGDAWFDSGDLLTNLGWRHAAFADRIGDTFRWKSENVSTLQVEDALGAAGVEACVVYGVEVPGMPGRAGMAAVVGESWEPGELLAALQAALPAPAIPVFLRRVAALETTGTFKKRKAGLQAEGYGGDGALVLRGGRYEELDAELRAALAAGDLRL